MEGSPLRAGSSRRSGCKEARQSHAYRCDSRHDFLQRCTHPEKSQCSRRYCRARLPKWRRRRCYRARLSTQNATSAHTAISSSHDESRRLSGTCDAEGDGLSSLPSAMAPRLTTSGRMASFFYSRDSVQPRPVCGSAQRGSEAGSQAQESAHKGWR